MSLIVKEFKHNNYPIVVVFRCEEIKDYTVLKKLIQYALDRCMVYHEITFKKKPINKWCRLEIVYQYPDILTELMIFNKGEL